MLTFQIIVITDVQRRKRDIAWLNSPVLFLNSFPDRSLENRDFEE